MKASQNNEKKQLPATMDSGGGKHCHYNKKIFDSSLSSTLCASYNSRYYFYDNDSTHMEEIMICTDITDFLPKREPKKTRWLGFVECFEFLKSLVS